MQYIHRDKIITTVKEKPRLYKATGSSKQFKQACTCTSSIDFKRGMTMYNVQLNNKQDM